MMKIIYFIVKTIDFPYNVDCWDLETGENISEETHQ